MGTSDPTVLIPNPEARRRCDVCFTAANIKYLSSPVFLSLDT